jgi:hypothetical protein
MLYKLLAALGVFIAACLQALIFIWIALILTGAAFSSKPNCQCHHDFDVAIVVIVVAHVVIYFIFLWYLFFRMKTKNDL